MNIYLRKILKHDITHQISITKEVLNGFFGVEKNNENAFMKGKKSGYKGNVTFLLATDPRFGGDIKQIINAEGGMEEGDILLFVKNKDGYVIEVITKSDSRHNTFISMMDLERHLIINVDNNADVELEEVEVFNNSDIVGINKLYYGIPGCGKSYKVTAMLSYKKEFQEEANRIGIYKKVSPNNIFRTTFYLDYANSDFIGQLMPKTEGDKVFYRPVVGPFTKALKRALETDEMVYLVIEEINRGNAAAIFGDTFQLLDRYKEGSNKGESMYPITNDFIEDYLGIEKGKVVIPSNLSIIATMNTSDQNVFPLDTAFKRRWDRERVVPNWEDDSIKDFVGMYIPYTDIKWKYFAEKINEKLSEESKDGMILEDKQLGPFYIGKDILTKNPNEENEDKLYGFVNNVIDYLYNDVTKFDHSMLFEQYNGYDDLYDSIVDAEKRSNERVISFGLRMFNEIDDEQENESSTYEEPMNGEE